jgi:hypothetical protein
MQKTDGTQVEEGVEFTLNHPTIYDSSVYKVKGVRKSNFGLIISYDGGEVHESLCNFHTS